MNTKPTVDRREESCQIERVDDEKRTYMCCKPTKTVWVTEAGIDVSVCSECVRWLRTLESLDRKL